jgi:lipopolysaccharide transport system ATP-binding protein
MAIVIHAQSLSKKYVIGHRHIHPYQTLRDEIAQGARALVSGLIHPFAAHIPDDIGTDYEEFWALSDVSFEIGHGERIGIIGRNGAGKSTLLKILSRITEPSRGRVTIAGRVASLLEIGTGFHPELSGRENIFLNGAILGMKRAEIVRKFDEIVAFAEIEKFLDTPVKRYSSGMYVRLAFAVAAHLEPEIMIVDEVLAVGDVKFQKKCLGKMEEIGAEGRTVLFVSHNMHAIRQLCDRAILLAAGKVVADDSSSAVIDKYLDDAQIVGAASPEVVDGIVRKLPPNPDCRFLRVAVMQDGVFTTRPDGGKPIDVVFEYEVLREAYGFHVFFRLIDGEGEILFESMNCAEDDEIPNVAPGTYRSVATIPGNLLSPRRYDVAFDAGIAHKGHCLAQPIRIAIDVEPGGRVNRLFPGYATPGKLLPSIPWKVNALSREAPVKAFGR